MPPLCPIPLSDYPQVVLAHGGGGRMMQRLIASLFAAAYGDRGLDTENDAAVLPQPEGRLALTTDSFVVHPLFFPGGDIGRLAVFGTVNDLAMRGARPLYLSLGWILEEGLSMETLWRAACSVGEAARETGIAIVTGDTKVVERGKGDGIFLNSAGVGVLADAVRIGPRELRADDVLILSGDLGRHGLAVLAKREGLAFESAIVSDCAPLWDPVQSLLRSGAKVHALRDLTRGGLAAALNEWAATSRHELRIEQSSVPVREDVRAACELLGLDPLYVANEGRFVAAVAPEDAEVALEALRRCPVCGEAARIGWVGSKGQGEVVLQTELGTTRVLDLLSGEQLPRIC